MLKSLASRLSSHPKSPPPSSPLKLFSGSHFLLHPDSKPFQTRSDHSFYSENFLCITDGAASWKTVDDPYVYSKSFIQRIQKLYFPDKIPLEILTEAHSTISESGGSCCLLLSLDQETGILSSNIVGDCGFLIIRKKPNSDTIEIIYSSKERTKIFNRSTQISKEYDFLGNVQTQNHKILPNDIIISGSDGLFDNVYPWDILSCMNPFVSASTHLPDPELVAEIIASIAFKNSQIFHYRSPFSERAKDYFIDFVGGKPDDITVIVSQVVEDKNRKNGANDGKET